MMSNTPASTPESLDENTTRSTRGAIANVLVSLLSFLCFIALIPMVALAITWIFALDVPAPVVVIQSAMEYILLAAFPIFLFAVIAKQKVLATIAALVAICHLYFFVPQLQSAADLPAATTTAPRFTLLSHNIRYDNQDPLQEVDEIQRVAADIVFLQEITPRGYQRLGDAGAFDSYPYRQIDARTGATGLAIFSKFPLREATVEQGPGYPQQRAVTTIEGHDVVLWNVHLRSPVAGPIEQWRGDLDFLRRKLHAETGDVLAAGDFNATWSHAPFRKLLTNGYREAAIDRGRGHSRSWPVDGDLGQRTKGFIRIDHVLTHHNVRAVNIQEAGGNGSDHRAVITELALLP
jgi:endonuclease/exonuclease/phosphatase (EEP) superfamily protein YafD